MHVARFVVVDHGDSVLMVVVCRQPAVVIQFCARVVVYTVCPYVGLYVVSRLSVSLHLSGEGRCKWWPIRGVGMAGVPGAEGVAHPGSRWGV